MRNLLNLLLAIGWLASAEAGAQAHGPPAAEFRDVPEDLSDPAVRSAKLAELDAWLRRMPGFFQDAVNPRSYKGEWADCKGIGSGAGVQCFSSMDSLSYSVMGQGDTLGILLQKIQPENGRPATSLDSILPDGVQPEDQTGFETPVKSGGARSLPEARLFGLDTSLLRINYLQVNSKGLPEGGLGKVSGDTLYLRFKCIIPENERMVTLSCEQRLRIRAVAGSREVAIASEIIVRRKDGEMAGTGYRWLIRLPEGKGGIRAD